MTQYKIKGDDGRSYKLTLPKGSSQRDLENLAVESGIWNRNQAGAAAGGVPSGLADYAGMVADAGIGQLVNTPADMWNAARRIAKPFGGTMDEMKQPMPSGDVSKFLKEGPEETRGILGRPMPSQEDFLKMDRPAFKAGQFVGASVPGGAAMKAANMGKAAMAAELTSSAAGAGGAYAAENIAPGDPTTALLMSGGASLLAPGMVLRAAPKVAKGAAGPWAKLTGKYSKKGRELTAGRQLRQQAEAQGENVPELIRNLERSTSPTAATGAGSEVLEAHAKRVGATKPQFAKQYGKASEEAAQEVSARAKAAYEGGDPKATAAAYQAEAEGMLAPIRKHVDDAQEAAQTAVSRNLPERNIADTGVAADKARQNALEAATGAENKAWNTARQGADDIIDPGPGFLSSYDTAQKAGISKLKMPDADVSRALKAYVRRTRYAARRDDLVNRLSKAKTQKQADALGKRISAFDSRIAKMDKQYPMTAEQTDRLRRELTNEAQKLRTGATPDFAMARRVKMVRDSLKKSLEGHPGYGRALAVSAAKKKLHSDGYVGKATTQTNYGRRIEPEQMTEKGVLRGGVTGNIASREMQQAAEGLPRMPGAPSGSKSFGRPMREAQSRALGEQARTKIAPEGVPSAKAASRFETANPDLVKQFPEVGSSVRKVGAAAEAAQTAAETAKKRISFLESKNAVVRASGKDAVPEIKNAFNDAAKAMPSASRSLEDLADAATKQGKEAVAGMRGVVMDDILAQSTKNGVYDPVAVKNFLRSPGMKVLRAKGVVSERHVRLLLRGAAQARRVKRALETGKGIDKIMDAGSPWETLVMRIGGARLASKGAAGTMSGSSIIVAGAGARAAERIFSHTPMGKLHEVFEQAHLNPEMMARILRAGEGAKAEAKLADYLISSWHNPQEALKLWGKYLPKAAGRGAVRTTKAAARKAGEVAARPASQAAIAEYTQESP